MKNNLKLTNDLIARIHPAISELKLQFENNSYDVGTRYVVIDGLLPEKTALEISKKFPNCTEMRHVSSFREKKFTSKNFNKHESIMLDITYALQNQSVINLVEQITGFKNMIGDPLLYAGGLSLMNKGQYLSPHIDNSHDLSRSNYRLLNLLYYVSPNWSLVDGGNLELWDRVVKDKITVLSKFNRLVIMETTPYSWHSVSRINADKLRCCVSNYYFSSKFPSGSNHYHVSKFSAWPDQKMLRFYSLVDSNVRQIIRKIVPSGFSKLDIYKN